MTDIRRISPDLSVSAQVGPEKFDALAAAGFSSVISNRPEDEERGQPSWEDAIIEAAAAGGCDISGLRDRLALGDESARSEPQ